MACPAGADRSDRSGLSHTQQGARFKVFTAEVVSLRLVSYSEAKAATYAQEGSNGATSGGRAKDISDNEEGVAAQTNWFNIDLSKKWPM